jgi:2-C-methyl-D-erythritol 2,4-cyclodiphosphate synthase
VEIPSDFGPDGHSDADVAIHALMDALLGAAALGDIGKHFPDSDEKWKGADSIGLLKEVYSLICGHGFSLGNADITVVLESPRLSPYIELMRATVADSIGVDIGRISVKATTEEGMGFTGNGSGISAYAVVLLHSF